jgi:hypothetical protein
MSDSQIGAAAYFLTSHTYGTWLPGDPRGSVRRGDMYGEAHRGPCDALERRSRALLRSPPVALDPEERMVVLKTLGQVCHYRGWTLHAAQVRTNHVHVVVTAMVPPGRVLGDLKAWASRRVVEAGHRPPGAPLWARGGSMRHLWNEKAISAACFYVVHEQGAILAGTVHLALSPPPSRAGLWSPA